MGNEHLLRRWLLGVSFASRMHRLRCWLQRLLERRAKQMPLHVSRTGVRSASCA
jgi:hypothetical protein